MPRTAEMFADVEKDASARADRLEQLKAALGKSIARRDKKVDGFLTMKDAEQLGVNAGIQRGANEGATDRLAALEAAARRFKALAEPVSKDMSTDDQASVTAELDALNALKDELAKDITVASPGNLHPYDLEAPAKILVPRFTPLRNEMPRQPGKGTAREFRRILGYTNTGMGGVANLTPFFNSESDSGTPTFGQLALRRGQKISYAMDVKTVGYVEMSLSDLVTWKAQFSNLGFEDTRQLSQMALLWAHLLGEERAILYGRGSGSGYEGVVAAPTPVTLSSAGSGTGSGFGTTAFVKITAYTGQGESLPSAEATSAVLTAGRPLLITLPSQPAGAIAYGVYASATTGTEVFQGFFVPGGSGTAGVIQVNNFVGGGAAVPGADGSASANGYDGFLSVLTDPNNAGYTARMDVTYPGKNIFVQGGANNIGDQPWQDAFASLYASVYADPEEVWVAAPQRRQLSDFLRSASNTSAAYRIHLSESEAGSATVGALVTGLVNESSPTGRVVDLRVHPYMPVGASFIRSVTLPIPDSHISETSVVTSVQDYMSVEWEPIQFTHDASTYWLGTLVHYAPKWSASLLALQ